MLSITVNSREANLNTTEILSYRRKMAVIKKPTNNKCKWGFGENGPLFHCLWKWTLVQLLWKSLCRFLTTLELEISSDSAMSLLDIFPEKIKTSKHRDKCTLIFTAEQHVITKSWKQTKFTSTNEWINISLLWWNTN